MRGLWLPLAAALLLAGCSDPNAPYLGLGVGFGSNGVQLTPRATTRVGNTSLGVSPHGAAIGTTIGNVGIGASL